MKTIAIASINSKSIVVLEVNDNLKSVIRKAREGILYLKDLNFEEGAILNIPYQTDKIMVFGLSTIYKSRFARDESICEPNFIEYLMLDEEDRIDFANTNNLSSQWYISENGMNLSNFTDVGFVTNILFENDLLNFDCILYGEGNMRSESIPCDMFF